MEPRHKRALQIWTHACHLYTNQVYIYKRYIFSTKRYDRPDENTSNIPPSCALTYSKWNYTTFCISHSMTTFKNDFPVAESYCNRISYFNQKKNQLRTKRLVCPTHRKKRNESKWLMQKESPNLSSSIHHMCQCRNIQGMAWLTAARSSEQHWGRNDRWSRMLRIHRSQGQCYSEELW